MESAVNKTVLDLYKKLHKSFSEKRCLYICKAIHINRMGFCSIHKVKLKLHFLTQRPTESQYPEFYNNSLFNKQGHIDDGWFIYDRTTDYTFVSLSETEAFSLRIKFLEAIIENLEKNPQLNLEL